MAIAAFGQALLVIPTTLSINAAQVGLINWWKGFALV